MTRRILLSYLTLTIFVLMVLVVPLGINFAHNNNDKVLGLVERDAWFIAAQASEMLKVSPVDPQAQRDLQQVATDYFDKQGGRMTIVDQTGISVVDGDPAEKIGQSFANRPEVRDALLGKTRVGSRGSVTLNAVLVFVAVPVVSGAFRYGAVRITYPPVSSNRSIIRNWITLGLVALISLIVAAIVGVILARSVTKPLSNVKTAALAIGDGNLAARAPSGSGPLEVRLLAGAFNDTAGRLQDLVSAQEAFVADASHQLRTPLTALRLRLETMEYDLNESALDDLEGALEEVARLSRLVDGLLALARADRTGPAKVDGPTDLKPHLLERQASWSALVAERGVELVVSGPEAVAAIPVDHLTQIIDNLLANALEVMHPGQTVILSTEVISSEWCAVHIIDEGPGMTPAERSRAFDRFWRATNKPGELGGSGLGLAIVRKLARTSGGEVTLEEATTGGIDAVVKLPLVGKNSRH